MFNNLTDTIVCSLFLLFFYAGWRKGILRVLIGPISLFVMSILGIIEYDVSHNLFKALWLTILGTTGLSLGIRFLLFLGRRTVDVDHRNKMLFFSHVMGGLINTLWKGSFICLFLLGITAIPFKIAQLDDLKRDINHSETMAIMNSAILGKIPPIKTVLKTVDIIRHPNRHEEISQSPEYQAFTADPKVQAFLSDREVTTLIEQRNFFQLLAHPKVKKMLQDENAMQKLSRLSSRIYQSSIKNSNKPDENKAK